MSGGGPPGERTVLVVSYFYPPFQSVGALRVSKITKHLPSGGWRPVVLTVDHDDLPATMPVEVPPEAVYRSRSFDVNRLPKVLLGRRRVATKGFYVGGRSLAGRALAAAGAAYRDWTNMPDGQVGWYPFAVRRGLEVIRREKPQLIYSSASPATSHLVARRLSALTGIPWIAEFRDPWTDNPNYVRPAPLRPLERRLEAWTLAAASALVAVTPEREAELARRFGKRTGMVPNGFDADDYPRDARLLRDFTITFTGMLYPGHQTARPLFEALSTLRKARELPPGLRVRLVGRNMDELAREAAEVGVPDLVDVLPQVERAAALRMQVESTVLLLLLWMKGGDAWYPAKMFEYLGAGRPILAIGPDSNEAAQLLRERRAGTVAPDAATIESALRAWIASYRQGGPEALTGPPALPDFDRRALVARLAALFDSVVPSAPPSLGTRE